MSFYKYTIFGPDALTIVGGTNNAAMACELVEQHGGYMLDLEDRVWRDDSFAQIEPPTSSDPLVDGEAAA